MIFIEGACDYLPQFQCWTDELLSRPHDHVRGRKPAHYTQSISYGAHFDDMRDCLRVNAKTGYSQKDLHIYSTVFGVELQRYNRQLCVLLLRQDAQIKSYLSSRSLDILSLLLDQSKRASMGLSPCNRICSRSGRIVPYLR